MVYRFTCSRDSSCCKALMARFKELGLCVFVLWELAEFATMAASLRPPSELESDDEESGDWEEWQAGGAEEVEDGDAAQCFFCSDAMLSPQAVFSIAWKCTRLIFSSFELMLVLIFTTLCVFIRTQPGVTGVSSEARGMRI